MMNVWTPEPHKPVLPPDGRRFVLPGERGYDEAYRLAGRGGGASLPSLGHRRYPTHKFASPVTSPITPTQLWVKADQIPTLADGDPVSTWSDQSGNSRDLTQSGAARPIYKTSIQNGKPVVRFAAASSQHLDVVSYSPVSSMTVFMAVNPDLSAGSRWMMGSGQVRGDIASGGFVWAVTGTPTNSTGVQSGSAGVWPDGPAPTSADNAITTGFQIMTLKFDGGAANNSKIFSNNAEIATVSGATVTVGRPLSLGCFRLTGDADFFGFFTGDIAEVIIYNSALDAAAMRNNWLYFKNKWGMSYSVP